MREISISRPDGRTHAGRGLAQGWPSPEAIVVPSQQQTHSIAAPLSREGLHRLSVVHFLIALLLMLVTSSFVDQFEDGKLIEAILVTLVLLVAVLADDTRR